MEVQTPKQEVVAGSEQSALNSPAKTGWDSFFPNGNNGEAAPIEEKKEVVDTEKKAENKENAPAQSANSEEKKEPTQAEVSLEPSLDHIKLDEDLKLGTDVNYTTLGKMLGVEVKEDNLAALKESLKQRDENLQKEWGEANFMKGLEKQKPEAQMAFVLANEGYDLARIANPFIQIDSLLKMDNFSLVEQDLRESGSLNEEQIKTRMEELATNGQIDKIGNDIKNQLSQERQVKADKVNTIYQNALEKHKKQEQSQRSELLSSIEKEILSTNEYAGMKLTDELKNSLIGRMRMGKYDEAINNAASIGKLIIHETILPYALNEIKQKTREAVLREEMNKKHNIPNQSTASIQQQATASGWDAFK